MFGLAKNQASTYATIGIETGVIAASPHQLIVMLFEGALVAVNAAARHLQEKNIQAKGLAISKAMMIIESGLRASLNKEIGGEIALNLDALYEYMSNRLFTANLNNDVALIEEVRKLLLDLKNAWEQVPLKEPAAFNTSADYSPQSANVSLGSLGS